MTTTVPFDVFQRERKRRMELEQFIKWEDELFENAELSTSQRLIARATRRAVLQGKPREDGLTYVSMERIAQQAGVSVSTARRSQQYLAQLGVMERKVEESPNQEGEQRSHVFVKLTEMINTPSKIIPEKARNHGGRRLPCPACGSHNLKFQQRLICKDCGNVSILHEHEQDADEDALRHDEEADHALAEHIARQDQHDLEEAVNEHALDEHIARQDPLPTENHYTDTSLLGQQRDQQEAERDSPLCVNLTDMVVLESNVLDEEDSKKPAKAAVDVATSQEALKQNDPIIEAAQLLLDMAGLSPEHPTRCATRKTVGWTLDFWNQNGQKGCILWGKYFRPKDEAVKGAEPMWHRKATSSSFRCSFCHKSKDQVEHLLAGPQGVYICNTCVDCCQQVMQKEREKQPVPPRS